MDTANLNGEHVAVLLRKPPTWHESCPSYSLAVFDPIVDLKNASSPGRRLDEVVEDKDIYAITDGNNKPRGIGDIDRQAWSLWSKILQGEESTGGPWPAL